jgi:hypothetical protein
LPEKCFTLAENERHFDAQIHDFFVEMLLLTGLGMHIQISVVVAKQLVIILEKALHMIEAMVFEGDFALEELQPESLQ